MYKQLKQIVVWFSRKRILLFVLILLMAQPVATLFFFEQKNTLIYPDPTVFILLSAGVLLLLLIEIVGIQKINQVLKLQKEHYSIILSNIEEGLITTDKSGQVNYMNPRAEQLTGWSGIEAKNEPLQKIYNVVNEETGEPFEHVMNRILQGGKKIEWENNIVLVARNTGRFIISNSGMPLLDSKGNISGAVVVFNDITEMKNIENELRQNEKQYRDLIQNLPEAVYTCDAAGYIKLYNKAAVDLWGRQPIVGKDLWCGSWKIFNTDGTDLPLDSCPMAITLKEGRPVHGKEIKVQRPDGKFRYVLPYPSPLFNADGQLTGAINMLIDVTDKREKEILINKNEEKYRSLIEQASDAILIYSFDGTIHEFNRSCYTMLGYTQEEYTKLKLTDILVGEIIINQENYAAILGGATKILYRHLICKDGSLIATEVTVKMLTEGKAIAFARDITERKKGEDAIKKEKGLSDSIINSLPGVFYLLDENVKFLRWNKNFETITGYNASEIAGMHPLDFFDEDEKEVITKKIAQVFTEGEVNVETCFYTKNHKKIPFYLTGYKIENEGKVQLIGVGVDITERKSAETKTKAAIERYDILADATSDTIWDWDIVNNKMLYNEGITKMFGYESSEVENVVDWWNDKLHPDDFGHVSEILEDIFEKNLQRLQLTYRFRCADGSYKDIFDRAFVIFDENGKPFRMIGAMQDITHLVLEEIRIAKAILDAQEGERCFIGAELHDNINQILAGSLLYIGMVKSNQVVSEKSFEFIETGKGYITEAINEVRKLSHELAPVSFDDCTLKDIFDNLLLTLNINNGYNIQFQFHEGCNELSRDIQTNLYRILQESTKNILKYSEATAIEIEVTLAGNTVNMRIFDNGRGFNTKTMKNGIGLSNIKRRTYSLLGKFLLKTAPGKGCEILVEIPLNMVA